MSEEPTGLQRLKWLRRAETINRKAEDLMYEVTGALGVEHPLTDYIDNVVHMSEEAVNVLRFYHNPPPSKANTETTK